MDGNLFGDPVYEGEVRWYPPLVPALAAAGSWLFGITDLLSFWVQVSPWVNLLVPATFFLRRSGYSARPPRQLQR